LLGHIIEVEGFARCATLELEMARMNIPFVKFGG
jgi:hypothetical protein